MLRSPTTPPYLVLLFYTAQIVSALADLVAEVLNTDQSVDPGQLCADVVRSAIPTFLLWIGGTLPLENVLPAPNVATDKDVRSLCPYDRATRTTLVTPSVKRASVHVDCLRCDRNLRASEPLNNLGNIAHMC